jgi:hypothetical protein
MAIRGFGRRPDRPTDIGADLDRMTKDREAIAPSTHRSAAAGAAGAAAGPAAAGASAAPAGPAAAAAKPATGRRSSRAATAPNVPPAQSEPPAPDPNRIGVVVIHGIGNQKPGETLLTWAHSLLRVVNAWATTTPDVPHSNDHALTADIDLSGGTRPWVAIDVPQALGHAKQTWLLTEAWWAARVTPPSLADMFDWLVPSGEIRSLIAGVFHGVDQQDRTLRAIDRVFLVPFVWLATALALLLYVVLSAVRIVPYQPLRDSVLFKALDAFLIDWFGDLRAVLTDRTQAASIRSRAIDAIRACVDQGCGTIVVIGHSAGTIVGYTTLADTALEPNVPIARFITLGQALGIGWRLGHVQDPSIADRDPDRLYEGDRLRTPIETARPGVEWHDFWATHDPAPAGGFANAPSLSRPSRTGGTSTMVFNHMSLLEDHGGYWDNDEEFLLPVARLLDTAPARALASTSRFFPESATPPGGQPTPDDRSGRSPVRARARQQRVEALQRSWAMVMIAGALAVPAVVVGSIVGSEPTYQRGFEQLWGAWVWLSTTPARHLWSAFGVGLPGDPPDGLIASLIGMALMAVAFWGVGKIASGLWLAWDARERQIALQPVPQWRPIREIEGPLVLCGIAALTLLAFAATGNWWFAMPALLLIVCARVMSALLPKGTVINPPG